MQYNPPILRSQEFFLIEIILRATILHDFEGNGVYSCLGYACFQIIFLLGNEIS